MSRMADMACALQRLAAIVGVAAPEGDPTAFLERVGDELEACGACVDRLREELARAGTGQAPKGARYGDLHGMGVRAKAGRGGKT